MIDTVSILIPRDKVVTTSVSGQSGPSWDMQAKTNQYEKFVRNPSKKDKESGLYFPRLTGYRRKSGPKQENVRIEFSASKLLYLNNLDELEDKNFCEVLDVLKERLEIMGVYINKAVLENAEISSVHFSRNLQLKDGYTVQHIISEINKVNISKTFDVARARFINNGQSFYIHTSSYQFTIYDKIADLNKAPKKAIDKDQPSYQKSLFFPLSKKGQINEVLRFEVRLSRQKVKKLLESFNFNQHITFKNVFNSELSKRIIKYYWDELIRERNLGLFSIPLSIKNTLRSIFSSNQKIKSRYGIYLAGLFLIGKDEDGIRELRSILSKNNSDRSWFRTAKDMKLASEIITKNRIRDWVVQIDNGLEEYNPYKCPKDINDL